MSSVCRAPGASRPAGVFSSRGALDAAQVSRAAEAVLVDPVVETYAVRLCDERGQNAAGVIIHVLPKPGVTDPEADSARRVLRDLGFTADFVRTVRSYEVTGPSESLPRLINKVLANEAVEQAVLGPIRLDHLGQGHAYRFRLVTVPIRAMDDAALLRTSRDGQLSLSLEEMRTIQAHFRGLGRDPTDCELETLAQTWSEHCSHKTLRGRVEFEGQVIDNLLKQTIFQSTQDLNLDWLVSVFVDNAGVVRFDDEVDVCFKVETHNHPSAIDPYGGSNTGLGGVIRDVLGTGRGAKPIASTDVFCVAPPDTDPARLPPGVIHPRRVLEGIVAGVRDYGNRMGIPTVNGAVLAHPAYLANPLVFCGTVGVLPRGMATKHVEPGDRIIALGGRTGRDGIHGATFSSIELSADSEEVSGGAVQIGNAITEKMLTDVLLQARDRGLYHAVTDCGAGGFSSAVGEMGAQMGAEVDLDTCAAEVRGAVLHRDLDLGSPGAHGFGRAARILARAEGAVRCGRRRGDRPGPVRPVGTPDPALSRAGRLRPGDGFPARRRPARHAAGAFHGAPVCSRRRPRPGRFFRRPARRAARLGRGQQGMDHPAV